MTVKYSRKVAGVIALAESRLQDALNRLELADDLAVRVESYLKFGQTFAIQRKILEKSLAAYRRGPQPRVREVAR